MRRTQTMIPGAKLPTQTMIRLQMNKLQMTTNFFSADKLQMTTNFHEFLFL